MDAAGPDHVLTTINLLLYFTNTNYKSFYTETCPDPFLQCTTYYPQLHNLPGYKEITYLIEQFNPEII